MTEEERKPFVQRVVRESIKEEDGGDVPVTQDTSLGPAGLGHACSIRQRYHPRIAKALKARGCRMKTVTPAKFCGPEVRRVRDVTKLVLNDMECEP